jgi:hypothetical protein
MIENNAIMNLNNISKINKMLFFDFKITEKQLIILMHK